jgi:hypothetical protein
MLERRPIMLGRIRIATLTINPASKWVMLELEEEGWGHLDPPYITAPRSRQLAIGDPSGQPPTAR